MGHGHAKRSHVHLSVIDSAPHRCGTTARNRSTLHLENDCHKLQKNVGKQDENRAFDLYRTMTSQKRWVFTVSEVLGGDLMLCCLEERID